MRKLTLSAALLAATTAQAGYFNELDRPPQDSRDNSYQQMQLDRIEQMQRQQLIEQEEQRRQMEIQRSQMQSLKGWQGWRH